MYQRFVAPTEIKLRYGLGSFWKSRRDQHEPIQFSIHPDGHADIILEISNHSNEIRNIWLTGFENLSRDREIESEVYFIGLQFHPGALTNLPMAEIGNRSVEMSQVHKGMQKQIENAYAKSKDINNLIYILYSIQNFVGEVDTDLLSTSFCLRKNSLGIDFNCLAKDRNISLRTLERKFNKRTGLTPSEFYKILRFQTVWSRAKEIIASGEEIHLATLALDCGYSDQSHMNREVKRITGLTPAKFFL